ncbi:MAG: LptF/LptG family permease [Acidobacteria bacterium]|nr:LptF/LptG family permease [Acidobacteriota bacterium]
MKILQRQIFREVLSHTLLGLLLFTFILFLRDTTRLLEIFLRETALGSTVAYLSLLTFPALLTFSIPMSVLVGILIALSRMSSQGEVTALRASGIGIRIFFLPLGTLAILACAIGLYVSAYLFPRANRARVELEREIGLKRVSAQVQPRVFEERFPNLILYVQDSISGSQPIWKGIFLADLSNPSVPKVTMAREGVLLSDDRENLLQLHLVQGHIHEAVPESQEYSLASFSETDIPIRLPPPPPPSVKPNAQRYTWELYRILPDSPEWLEARLEFHRRFALPFATLFLSLIGIPLGLSSHKGGKSSGIVLTLLVVLAYYSLFIGGISLARQGWLPAWAGVWSANLLFGLGGAFLLARVDRVSRLSSWLAVVGDFQDLLVRWLISPGVKNRRNSSIAGPSLRIDSRWPFILDTYVAKTFLFYLALVLGAFLLLTDVVTFFLDLLNDVIRNHIPASMVLGYFLHLTPYLLYLTAPLAVLVAILVSFAVLSQRNEITAVKASGISLYRLTVPILLLSSLLSVGLFFFEYSYIPSANRRQDAIRNQIKGRPAQTYFRPDRRWIFGQGPRIYYYNFFAPAERVLGGITVFELDPASFQLTRRISAARAHWEASLGGWVFEDGWVRRLRRDSLESFESFQIRLFPEFSEPPSYFLKEVKQSSQMNFLELRRYLQDLRQSGFDVVPLDVQLHKKFSFPSFALIMALIGLPFAFSFGRRGALTGIAVSLAIAIVYWGVSSLFEALGNLNELPPVVAAWSPNLLFGLGGLYLFLKIET